jgi:hypothetical protein
MPSETKHRDTCRPSTYAGPTLLAWSGSGAKLIGTWMTERPRLVAGVTIRSYNKEARPGSVRHVADREL